MTPHHPSSRLRGCPGRRQAQRLRMVGSGRHLTLEPQPCGCGAPCPPLPLPLRAAHARHMASGCCALSGLQKERPAFQGGSDPAHTLPSAPIPRPAQARPAVCSRAPSPDPGSVGPLQDPPFPVVAGGRSLLLRALRPPPAHPPQGLAKCTCHTPGSLTHRHAHSHPQGPARTLQAGHGAGACLCSSL